MNLWNPLLRPLKLIQKIQWKIICRRTLKRLSLKCLSVKRPGSEKHNVVEIIVVWISLSQSIKSKLLFDRLVLDSYLDVLKPRAKAFADHKSLIIWEILCLFNVIKTLTVKDQRFDASEKIDFGSRLTLRDVMKFLLKHALS